MHDFVYFQYNARTRPKKRDWHNTSDYYVGVFGVGGLKLPEISSLGFIMLIFIRLWMVV